MKRLFFDLETSPNVVLSWRTGYKINIDEDNILHERAIICIGYKWEGGREANVLTWDREQNDKPMLRRFLAIANEADELVAHNGDNFDMPWFRTRCALHDLQPLPDYKTVDTLQWARRKFYFNSNKLNYIAKFFGIGHKIKTEFGLWKDVVLKRDAKALDKMARYCARDVLLLEKVWRRLAAIEPHKTHVGVLHGGEKWSCPHCGSEDVKHSKKRVTAMGVIQHQMQCKKCGHYYKISDKSHGDYLEAKKDKK